MTLKLKNVLEINSILKLIIDNDKLKIDPLFKFKLLGIMKNIEIPVANFSTIRDEKIMEYGKEAEDENGNKTIAIPADDKELLNKFTKEINNILESDVDISIQKLKPVDVFDKGLSSEYLIKLYPVIEG